MPLLKKIMIQKKQRLAQVHAERCRQLLIHAVGLQGRQLEDELYRRLTMMSAEMTTVSDQDMYTYQVPLSIK